MLVIRRADLGTKDESRSYPEYGVKLEVHRASKRFSLKAHTRHASYRCLMTGNLATGFPTARIGGLRRKQKLNG